ncbi:MAG: HAD-IIB family hydrolase [Verrucomicrobiales bacterium]|nr:HAD-IIB family hydrolase [Verrucomicrobiales bacterium]
MALKLISTDFDGTIFSEFENPPIAKSLQNHLQELRRRGGLWVINTGRDLSSLLETLGRAQISVHPDALVLVEREIYVRHEAHYVPLTDWNTACTRDHKELFARVTPDLEALVGRLEARNRATFYEDAFSPLCVIGETLAEANAIHAELEEYARTVPRLTVVRNDVYIRFAHAGYNKGLALAEIARRLKIQAADILVAGDHHNDLPMLDTALARWLVAPANAIPEVKDRVRALGGYVSSRTHGEGVAQGIEYVLEQANG